MVPNVHSLARRRLIALVAFVIGLYAAWRLSLALVYRVENFEPNTDPMSTDCDQCGLTVILDAIGYFLGGTCVYLVIALIAWLALRRAGWLGRRTD